MDFVGLAYTTDAHKPLTLCFGQVHLIKTQNHAETCSVVTYTNCLLIIRLFFYDRYYF